MSVVLRRAVLIDLEPDRILIIPGQGRNRTGIGIREIELDAVVVLVREKYVFVVSVPDRDSWGRKTPSTTPLKRRDVGVDSPVRVHRLKSKLRHRPLTL